MTPANAPDAQDSRRRQMLTWVREADRPRFTADGGWIGPGQAPDWRRRWLHALALFEGTPADVALANRLIEEGTDDLNDFGLHFYPLLPKLFGDRLSPAALAKLDHAYAARILHGYRHLFRYTENCGLLIAFGLLEGAERFQRPEFRDKALLFLESFASLLDRYDTSAEYFSVNYWGVTLGAAAAIRQFATDPRARELAARIEDHLWHELAAVWHPNLHYSTGPSGRSYVQNQMPSLTSMHVWTAVGDRLCPSLKDYGFFDDAACTATRPDELPFCQTAHAWTAILRYTPPAEAVERICAKTFPYEYRGEGVVGTWREHEVVNCSEEEASHMGGWYSFGGDKGGTAYVPSTVSYPGGRVHCSTYMMPDWGVGTASRQMGGQSSQYYACWRRRAPVARLGDLRTVFPRYVVNDALESHLDKPVFGELPEDGRGGAMQSGPLALAWYAGGEVKAKAVSRLRTCIIIPVFYGEIDEVWIGNRRCPDLTGDGEQAEWVYIKDGPCFAAFRPLVVNQHGSRRLLEVKKLGHFRVITCANYDGPARDFHPALLRQTGGGFVAIHGSESEWPGGFAEFRRSCAGAEILDDLYQCHRRMRVRWQGREVETIFDMQGAQTKWLRTEQGFVSGPA